MWGYLLNAADADTNMVPAEIFGDFISGVADIKATADDQER